METTLIAFCQSQTWCSPLFATAIQWTLISLQVLGALVLLATVLVRIPAFSKYSDEVGTVRAKFIELTKWLPTIGVNPNTKKLEEQFEDIKAAFPQTPPK